MCAALREKAAGIQFAQKNGCCTDRVRQLFCLRKASKAEAWFPGRQAKYAGNMEEGMKKRIVSLVLALVLVLGLLPGPVMAAWPSFRGNDSMRSARMVSTSKMESTS